MPKIASRRSTLSTLYQVIIYYVLIKAIYILKLSFPFPLLELKGILSTQKVVVQSYMMWGGKDIEIHTCPNMSLSSLDKHMNTN